MNGYITLDYELGLGSFTGTPEKCLIEPMCYLSKIVDKYNIKMNIFVDAAYLLQLNLLKDMHPQLEKDYNVIINHIKKLDSEGHAIQLHLHPQWLYSVYNDDKWVIDKDHYKLSDMPIHFQKELIIDGVNLLNSLISKKVTSFRAGGYSIEFFSNLYETFLSMGIYIDSSIYRGIRAKGKYNEYDYRNVPKKTSWKVLYNHKNENYDGGMIEYPISTIPVQAIKYLLNKHIRHPEFDDIHESKKIWGDGKTLGAPGNKFHRLIRKIEMLFEKKAIRASIEQSEDLEKVYSYSCEHYKGDDFVIIGHPKAISPYNIAVLERFILNHPEIEFKLFS